MGKSFRESEEDVKIFVIQIVVVIITTLAVHTFEQKTGMSLGENLVRFICE